MSMSQSYNHIGHDRGKLLLDSPMRDRNVEGFHNFHLSQQSNNLHVILLKENDIPSLRARVGSKQGGVKLVSSWYKCNLNLDL